MARTPSVRRCLGLAPATITIPTRTVARTIVVPTSGWRNTSNIGKAASAEARITYGSDRSDALISERNAASITINATFIHSDGDSANPETWNERWAPLTVVPSGVLT